MLRRKLRHLVVLSTLQAFMAGIKAVDNAATKGALPPVVERLHRRKHVIRPSADRASGLYPAVVRTMMSLPWP